MVKTMPETKCIICDSENFIPASKFHDDLVQCKQCGLISYKAADNIVLTSIYNQNYFEGRYYNYLADKDVLQKNFASRLKTIRKFHNSGKLLEVGSAYGFFLELAKKYYDVAGIDIVNSAVKYSKDILKIPNLICDDFLNSVFPADSFDIVCLFDTIEHLKEPHLYIKKCAKLLKKGGTIFLTTGDIGSHVARFQKKNWRLINIPTHLFYFSFATLEKILNNYGLEVVHKSYAGNYRSLAAMIYMTLIKEKNSLTKNKLFKLMERIHIYLNLYDIMFIGARKK